MSEFVYENLAEYLLDEFPDLRPRYEAEIKWWGDEKPGPHVVYGDILNPLIVDLLATRQDEERLKRVFDFLERLAKSDDVRVQEVVSVTVCEYLLRNRELLMTARRYMGQTTLRFTDEIEAFWKSSRGSTK